MRTCFYIGLIALLGALLLSGCVTRPKVTADIYQHEPISFALCQAHPDLLDFGIYRLMDCPAGSECEQYGPQYEEFIPYCSPEITDYLAIHQRQAEPILRDVTRPR